MNALQVLKTRGFIQQCSAEEELAGLLSRERVVYYAGFDPTAASLHVGSLMPIMAMVHLQQAGHIPIAVVGCGTAQVGDPSGKTEMRRMMSAEEINGNGAALLSQLQGYLPLDGVNGLFVNNADWLVGLDYLTFLRTIGRHFKVNEMIKVDAYRQRLEREEGLSFLEFNYQVLQAYDFLMLNQRHRCRLQMGGSDQWGNMVAGIDLIRKAGQATAYALTFPLLTTARGQKMGKTESGTIWLDPNQTRPYDFYQYWINTDDRDVERFLAYFTLLPMEEIHRLGQLEGADLREAKSILAFEVTRLAHGYEAALHAEAASRVLFAGEGEDVSAIPTLVLDPLRIQQGLTVIDLLCEIGFAPSKGAARRLILQGGAYLNGQGITPVDTLVTESWIHDGSFILRHGKKRCHRIVIRSGEA
jgi:tyrosyl-tRNA synthetase